MVSFVAEVIFKANIYSTTCWQKYPISFTANFTEKVGAGAFSVYQALFRPLKGPGDEASTCTCILNTASHADLAKLAGSYNPWAFLGVSSRDYKILYRMLLVHACTVEQTITDSSRYRLPLYDGQTVCPH